MNPPALFQAYIEVIPVDRPSNARRRRLWQLLACVVLSIVGLHLLLGTTGPTSHVVSISSFLTTFERLKKRIHVVETHPVQVWTFTMFRTRELDGPDGPRRGLCSPRKRNSHRAVVCAATALCC